MSHPEEKADTLTKSERAELDALRAAAAEREREESGIVTGKMVCVTQGCPFDEKAADMQKHVMRRVNEDTGVTENEVIQYLAVNEDDAICESCEYPLTLIPPDAQSVFPRNYRWVYPKPVK